MLEERNNLKEQLSSFEKRYKQLEENSLAKDKRIQQLENSLNLILSNQPINEGTDC